MPRPSLANRTFPLVASASLFLVGAALAIKYGASSSDGTPTNDQAAQTDRDTKDAKPVRAVAPKTDPRRVNGGDSIKPKPNSQAPVVDPPDAVVADRNEGTGSSRWQPIPDEDAQESAFAFVRDAFQSKIDRAASPEAKRALANELSAIGANLQDDAAARFVLLRLARDIGVNSGDAATTFDVINTTAESFDIDTLLIKSRELNEVAQFMRTADDRKNFFAYSWQTIDDAVEADRYEIALRVCDRATDLAREIDNAEQLTELSRRTELLKVQAEEFKQFESTVGTLLENPDSPALNLKAGRFLCFEKGDWLHGLPMLAKADEPKIKQAAAADLAKPQQLETQMAVGDTWWQLADDENENAKHQIQRRAVHWYQMALPKSTGSSKETMTMRITQFSGREDAAKQVRPEVAVRPKQPLILGSAYNALSVGGSYEVTWRAVNGASGKSIYSFGKDGTAKLNDRKVGNWQRHDKKVHLIFSDKGRGAVLITFPNKETMLGQHRTRSGEIITWFGKRLP
jgi:hypothetical protein